MTSVNRPRCRMQAFIHATAWITASIMLVVCVSQTAAQDALPVADSAAKSEGEMKSYQELIEHTD